MRAASLILADVRDSRAARRGLSLLLTILAHLLILLILLRTTGVQWTPLEPERRLVTVDIPAAAEIATKQTTKKSTARRQSAPPPPPSAPPPPPPKPDAPQRWVLNPELSQFDLRQTRSTPVERPTAQGAEEGTEQADSGSTYGPSNLPGGGRLFNAEWYREPSQAELAFYMPRGVIGWGEVACQTVERFHVDNCRELGESPAGSRMSRAVREAAWQFLVRPPRSNGKAMIGSWVRIRITLTADRAVSGGR
ncbi:hypothetical protein [uncultured Sphingomonas sp.]|uniref:hypothetical protein n=1 Tax=uncultured Sphingomonas sp. TaxID=158754 RepID=UPI0025F67DAB|nr:hypothetical protein [uncultured Sphingomonas sp.]